MPEHEHSAGFCSVCGRNEVINYVVEARVPPRDWITMTFADTEEQGRTAYDSWLASKQACGFSTEYRLVKRTAIITDEPLASTEDEKEALSG